MAWSSFAQIRGILLQAGRHNAQKQHSSNLNRSAPPPPVCECRHLKHAGPERAHVRQRMDDSAFPPFC